MTQNHSHSQAPTDQAQPTAREQNLPDPQNMGYEAARDELVSIVRTLEGGQAPLEDTLSLWERGESLANRCRSILEDAQNRLDRTSDEDTLSN